MNERQGKISKNYRILIKSKSSKFLAYVHLIIRVKILSDICVLIYIYICMHAYYYVCGTSLAVSVARISSSRSSLFCRNLSLNIINSDLSSPPSSSTLSPHTSSDSSGSCIYRISLYK